MEKLTTLFLTLVVILPLQSANLEVDIPWNWEQVQADAELIKNTNTNILPDFDFEEKATPGQYTIFWTLQVLDVYSTYRGLKYDCVTEANPLVGSNPNLARLVTHKTVLLHPVAVLQPYDILSERTLKSYNILYTTVVYNNYKVWDKAHKICKRR